MMTKLRHHNIVQFFGIWQPQDEVHLRRRIRRGTCIPLAYTCLSVPRFIYLCTAHARLINLVDVNVGARVPGDGALRERRPASGRARPLQHR